MRKVLGLLALTALAAAAQTLPVAGTFRTDLSKRSIDLKELRGGGPPKDGIPSIDDPKFVSAEAARAWLDDREPVMWVEHDGETRVYPLQILIYHELVNDSIGDLPFLVSYCPLCQSAVVFDRRLDGKTYTFGVSGMLRNSDMVMYDRETDSLWQQLTGDAIVGELTGKVLTVFTSRLTHFGIVRETRPAARVLSRETGVNRPYGQTPYVGYERGGGLMFPANYPHARQIRPLDRLVVMRRGDKAVAYPLAEVARAGVKEGKVAGEKFAIFFDPAAVSALDARFIKESEEIGSTGVFAPVVDGRELRFRSKGGRIEDRQTGSEWNVLGEAVSGPLAGKRLEPLEHGVFFAFAWLAFHPSTQVVGLPPDTGAGPEPSRTPAVPSPLVR
jgi:hypothetical protein